MNNNFSILSLGDSYTVGEGIPLQKSFPYQTTQLLRKKGFNFMAPEILAKTGWTTSELQKAIEEYSFLYAYDFVTLLIGVNNQYRGHALENYEKDFSILLSHAILLADKNPEHVFVLSIPDYSKTTFARNLDKDKITQELDSYNTINQRISETYNVHYINVTESSREAAADTSLLAADALHPSEKEYAKWAVLLSTAIKNQLSKNSAS